MSPGRMMTAAFVRVPPIANVHVCAVSRWGIHHDGRSTVLADGKTHDHAGHINIRVHVIAHAGEHAYDIARIEGVACLVRDFSGNYLRASRLPTARL